MKAFIFIASSLLLMLLASCSNNEPDSFSVAEKQYLMFDNLLKVGDPSIVGQVFFTKEGNRTKIRTFYYLEDEFRGDRPMALYQNSQKEGGDKVTDLTAFSGKKASYSETMWDVPYEQAIENSYHLQVFQGIDNDTLLAVADLGMSGFMGDKFNFDYALLVTENNVEQGKVIAWQRRNGDFFIKASLDSLVPGKRYMVDAYTGDTTGKESKKWLTIGEISGKKGLKGGFKALDVNKTDAGEKLDYNALRTADAHLEVRRMPDNDVVAVGAMGN